MANLKNRILGVLKNSENIILRGGISYNRYIWHSENGEHTCNECSSLDGQIFDSINEIIR